MLRQPTHGSQIQIIATPYNRTLSYLYCFNLLIRFEIVKAKVYLHIKIECLLWHVRRCNNVCGNICVVYRNIYGLKYICGLKKYLWPK